MNDRYAKMKAAFEKQQSNRGMAAIYEGDGHYKHPATQREWENWQDAWQAATEAAKATGTAGEPVAWHVTYGDGDLEHFTNEREAKAQVRDLEENGWLNVKLRPLVYAEAARQPAPVVAVPDELRSIGELLRTQDNRITDQPIFIVQQRRRITGIDTAFCENIVWLHSESEYTEADQSEHEELEAEYQNTGRQREGWLRTGYQDEWEFVTACFTEQGCKDYLAKDGHNLKEPRIYAEGSYRNEEFRAVRNWLMSLEAVTNRSQP